MSERDLAARSVLGVPMQRRHLTAEMERAPVVFYQLLANATSAELRAATGGTKWTNEQLLFHMLFEYLLVNNHNEEPQSISSSSVKGLRRDPRRRDPTLPHLNYVGSLAEPAFLVLAWSDSWTG